MAGEDVDISEWKQGDFCPDVRTIPVLQTLDEIADIDVQGLVMLSQTCDIVRAYADRPYVQFAAARNIDPDDIAEIQKHRRPQFAFAPGLAVLGLAADLDLVVTIDKKAMAGWRRVEGCASPKDQERFAYAAGRHKERFAFPDSVTAGLKKLRRWIESKGKRSGEDGRFIKVISQVRLTVADLNNPRDAEFLCILQHGVAPEDRAAWAETMIPKMRDMVTDWCADAEFIIADETEILLVDYANGVRLQFDDLTVS